MCFSTAPGVTTRLSAIAVFERPSAISSSTSRSRAVRRVSASIDPSARHEQLRDDLAVEHRATVGDARQRVEERPDVADALLQQIADPRRVLADQLAGVGRLDVLGQHEHPELGLAAARLDRRPQPLVAERRRQAHVHDREVRLVPGDRPAAGPGASSTWATTSIPFSRSSATSPSRSSARSSAITTRTEC